MTIILGRRARRVLHLWHEYVTMCNLVYALLNN